jgi:hypothetical protein
VLNRSPDIASDDPVARAKAKKRAQARAGLLRQTLRWHWISAAICLIGMLLFAATGFTLNHAADIKATPKVVERTVALPAKVAADLKAANAEGPLPASARAWLKQELKVKAPATAEVEWTDAEAYLSFRSPGADAWVSLDGASGEATYERTERGAIAYLNDLHKGRDLGVAWRWFIDLFALGCVVFCITGLILLQLHSHARKSTWPLVALGLVIPLIVVLFFIH